LFDNNTIPFTLTGQIRKISDKTFNLKGSLVIDVPTMFSNTQVYCDPGSSVTVLGYLAISNRSVFEGCDKMWKGISNFGYNLTVIGQSRISDAEWAIRIGDGSKITIMSAIFKNNIIGIQAPLTNQKNIIYGPPGGIINSTFIREGTMKPSYPGQNSYSEASVKGIYFSHVNNLKATNNDFIDIHEGIYATHTRVSIKENNFTSPNDLGIRGIYLQNLITNSNKINSYNTFDNLQSPIKVEFATLGALEITDMA